MKVPDFYGFVFRLGDELLSVNGLSLSNMSEDEVTDIFDGLSIGPVQLQIMRHPQVR